MSSDENTRAVVIGRYLLHRQIARGGMATIHIARLMGDEGFSRIVAAKRLLPEFAEDQEFVEMFLDEARIASRVHHRNVVPVLDVVTTGTEVILVQEYVHGAPLHWLLRTARQASTHVPLPVAISIACQVLAGLQAVHDTNDELGASLGIVHRDVSPQNVMVATDGTARLLDFGIAKATVAAAPATDDGNFKGKLSYSAPEQIRGNACQQSDVYSLAVVLWELIVGHRMHQSSQGEAAMISTIMTGTLPTITEALAIERDVIGDKRWKQLEELEPIIRKGLAVDLAERHASAYAMEKALAEAGTVASSFEVAEWLKQLGKELVEDRDKMIAAEEASWRKTAAPVSRRTPIPGELKAISIVADEPELPPAIARTPTPKSPTRLIIAILGLLVVGLGAVVLAMMMREERGGPVAPTKPSEAPTADQRVVTPSDGTDPTPTNEPPALGDRATAKTAPDDSTAKRDDPSAAISTTSRGRPPAPTRSPTSQPKLEPTTEPPEFFVPPPETEPPVVNVPDRAD